LGEDVEGDDLLLMHEGQVESEEVVEVESDVLYFQRVFADFLLLQLPEVVDELFYHSG
jgi:hypothetical protein